jgi:hypothetical protein
MPTARRRVVATSLAVLLAGGALGAAPAQAAGPTVIDDHDTFIPPKAYDISSSASGTLFGADTLGDHGRNYLIAGTMTTGGSVVDLGPGQWATVDPQIRGNRVALPQAGAAFDSPVTSVKSCAVGTCPTLSTLNITDGSNYIGNGEDRAILWKTDGVNSTISLANWAGVFTVTNTYVLPGVTERPDFAEGDTTGLIVSVWGNVYYVSRATGDVTYLGDGNRGYLTPTYAVRWGIVGGETEPLRTKVWRVLRSNPGGVPVETTLPGDPFPEVFAANDTGFAYLAPSDSGDGTGNLYTAAWDSTPAHYPRPITTNGLASLNSGPNFVVNDRLAGVPGFYKLAPGASSGSLTGLVPPRRAMTYAVSVSTGRAAYIDDMTEDYPLFVRGVSGGSLGAESTVTDWTLGASVGLSGPFVAFLRDGPTASTVSVVYGRTGGPFTTRTFPIAEVGAVGISGRTVYTTGGSRGRLIDVLTNTVTDLGTTYVGVFGRYAVTVDYNTGEVRRRDLVSGASLQIRPALTGCSGVCVDEEHIQIQVWGEQVVYAFSADGGRHVAELWDADAPTTRTALSALTTGGRKWYELKYWAGLLLVSHTDFTVKLYDLRTGTMGGGFLIDSDAERPLGIDGHVVAWRPNYDLRATVRDITDYIGGYAASPRYLGADAPTGLAPGVGTGTWAPRYFVSQDVNWTLQVRQGGAAGTIVHEDSGTSTYGEIAPKPWDGTNKNTGQLADHGSYTVVLTGTATTGGLPLLTAAGASPVAENTVFVSRSAPAAPTGLNAPTRSTDVTAGTSYGISWTASAGASRYEVWRSSNGGAYALYTTGSGTSATAGAVPGTTYRFKVRALDAGGRPSAFSGTDYTIVPHDAGGSVSGTWTTSPGASFFGGSQRRASAAGATWAFSATGTQIHLIGTKAANYGQFYVSIDGGAYAGPYDSYRSATAYRQVLYTKTGLSSGTHTIKVKVAGTSGRPYVGIDAVGYLR